MPIVGFVSAQELIDWINEGAQQIHEELVSAYDEEYVSLSATLVTVAAGTAPLPTGFFKLYSIEMDINGRTVPLLPYMRQERNAYKNSFAVNGFGFTPPKYSLVGGNVKLLPVPTTGTNIAITYAPEFTLLAAGGDTTTFPNGWEKWVVAYAAKQMLMKEESGTSELDKMLSQWDSELQELKHARDAASPKQSVDMDMVESSDIWGP